MTSKTLNEFLDSKYVGYVPIYSMFNHQTKLMDFGCDGNINRWMTNLYKSGQNWTKLSIFGPSKNLAKDESNFKLFKDKLNNNFKNVEYIESDAFSGGTKKQRSNDFIPELMSKAKDKIYSCDVLIVESQKLFMAIHATKMQGHWTGKLVYWCPVCATSKKTRSFLESSKELDRTCFELADAVIVATDEQFEYARELGVPEDRICVKYEFIDRTLPMFCEYEKDETTVKIVEKELNSGKTCIYLPFRLSDEGYKIWEILELTYEKMIVGDLIAFAPNLNGASEIELVNLCKINNCKLNEEQIKNALSKFKSVPSSRDAYYSLIDNVSELVIPYFEDYGFVMHAAVDELILGSKKPKCLVLESKEELARFLNRSRAIETIFDRIYSKKETMDKVFKALVSSDSFKQIFYKYNSKKELPNFIFTGVGKNWYICEKVVKTFISMGIQAQALDCTHALHGDLGMLKTSEDKVLIFVSRSGTTAELVKLAKIVKKFKDERILVNLDTIALFLNKNKPNAELFDEWIFPNDATEFDTIYEFDDRDLVPSLSINIIQMVLDLLGVILYEGRQELVDGYVYNHLSGGNGEKLGGGAILKDIH